MVPWLRWLDLPSLLVTGLIPSQMVVGFVWTVVSPWLLWLQDRSCLSGFVPRRLNGCASPSDTRPSGLRESLFAEFVNVGPRVRTG